MMDIPLDIWLRGNNHATTGVISPVGREPQAWTDADVAAVLVGMLRALNQAKNPGVDRDEPVALRGFSWIVSPSGKVMRRVIRTAYLGEPAGDLSSLDNPQALDAIRAAARQP